MQTSPTWPQKLAVDSFLLGVAVFLLFHIRGVKIGHPLEAGFPSLYFGVYLVYLGVLFLLSYFLPQKSCMLGGFIWVCENFSRPRGRHMAFVHFAISSLLGLAVILMARGVF
jgi:hypothetical protein